MKTALKVNTFYSSHTTHPFFKSEREKLIGKRIVTAGSECYPISIDSRTINEIYFLIKLVRRAPAYSS